MIADGVDLDRLRALVPDGATVAVGGVGMQRKPMALLRGLVEVGVRDLAVVAFLGSVDVEYLLARGIVAELHTAGVALEGVGLAPTYRAARQDGSPRVVEWSEGTLHAALEATARALPSLPSTASPRTALVRTNPWLRKVADPFDGTEVVQARALDVDVALLHATAVDEAGNLHVDGDPGVDGLLARAARHVIASVGARTSRPAREAAIARVWVDDVVVVDRGAWPTGCLPAEDADPVAVRRWAADPTLALLEEVPT